MKALTWDGKNDIRCTAGADSKIIKVVQKPD
jgi:hypothetical protein